MGDTMEYELESAVVVEDSLLGERYRFEGGPGRVKPKSEVEEAALAKLASDQPDVCKPVKPAPKAKG
jgi:hypothetical protein